MSVKVQSMVWDADIEHNQKFVLLALADQANDFGKECWPSIAHLAAKCNLSERAIQRNIAALEKQGLICRQSRYGRSSYFTIFLPKLTELRRPIEVAEVEIFYQDGAEVIHTPVKMSPRQNVTPQNLHPVKMSPPTGNPDSVKTPVKMSPPSISPNVDKMSPPPRQIDTHNHPFNHPTTSSTTEEKLSTASFENPESIVEQGSENLNRELATKLFQFLVRLESQRGKTLTLTPSDTARIQGWIDRGATESLIRCAHEKAVAQRVKQADPAPVSIGYLESIINSMLIQAGSEVVIAPARTGMSEPTLWYLTDAGIERRARERGYNKLSTETFVQFKHRVLSYEQVTPEQYNETLRAKGVI